MTEDASLIDAVILDAKHQNKGHGNAVLDCIITYIQTFPFGKANTVAVVCHEANDVAVRVFQHRGFVKTRHIDAIIFKKKEARASFNLAELDRTAFGLFEDNVKLI